MRIALPIWNDKVSPVLDTASSLLIVETDNLDEISRFKTNFKEQDISKRCLHIQDLKVNIVICGAISRPFSMLLLSSDIKIISGISGPAEDVLDAYLHGSLLNSKYLMPGCKADSLERNNDKIKRMNF